MRATPRFLDTNVLLRYLVHTDPEKANRARALLERVERREESVVTSTLVIFETVFTLQRTYKVDRRRIRAMLTDLLAMPGLQLAGKGLCEQALDLFVQYNISFADAYSAVYMQGRGLTEIYSWDTDFDALPGAVRVEPAEETHEAT